MLIDLPVCLAAWPAEAMGILQSTVSVVGGRPLTSRAAAMVPVTSLVELTARCCRGDALRRLVPSTYRKQSRQRQPPVVAIFYSPTLGAVVFYA